MPNAYYTPKPVNPIAPATSPLATMQATQQVADTQTEAAKNQGGEDAAQAFQKHLDAGYSAMVATLKEIPPDVAAGIPSPEAYADSEDKRVAWYMTVNDAVAKSNLLSQASDKSAQPDALRNTAAGAPMSPESQKAVGGAIDRLDQNRAGSKIQDIFSTPSAPAAAPASPSIIPNIDPRSQFGRGLKIKLAAISPHMDVISASSSQAGIPPSLVVAVAAQESGGNVDAVSATGVRGTMQVTQGTFKDMAAKYPDSGLTDRKDPKQSYTAGALYLGDLVEQFGGNIAAAIGAYNAGPSAIKSALEKYPEDWVRHLDEFLPAAKATEASDYVARVSKNFEALGGGTATKPKVPMTQTEANTAALKSDPNLLLDPRFKAMTSGLKTDATMAATEKKNSFASVYADARAARLALETQKFSQGQSKNLYDAITKQNLPQIHTQIMDLNSLLPGGLNTATTSLPDSGYLLNKFPAFLKSEKGVEFASVLQQLYNTELKRVSGGAVTDSEYKRFKQAYAQGATFSAKETLNALRAYVRTVKNLETETQAAYSGIWSDYQNKGGIVDPTELPDVGKRQGSTPDKPTGNAPKTGKKSDADIIAEAMSGN